MNNVAIMGRLVKDPTLNDAGSSKVARFTLAVDKAMSREKRDEAEKAGRPTADFISCVAWGKNADNLMRFSGKGKRILIQGRIETGSYEKDGQRVFTTDVVALSLNFIDFKESQQGQQQRPQQQQQQNYAPDTSEMEDFNFSDDDYPSGW